MAGISLGPSRSRRCSGEKTLRRCIFNEADDVILIDVDSEKIENSFIDVPDTLPVKKNKGSSLLSKDKLPFVNVIDINDDGIPNSSNFAGVENAGTSSSGESTRVAQKCKDAAVDESQFVNEKATPVKLSKCKRTYSGKFLRKNTYGLYSDSESDRSDDDYSDCEIEEGSPVKVQWQKAFSRKRKEDGTRKRKEASKSSYSYIEEIDAESFYKPRDIDSDSDPDFSHIIVISEAEFHAKRNDKFDARSQSNFQAKFHPSVHVEQAENRDSSFMFSSQKGSTKNIPIVEDDVSSKVGPSPLKPDISVEEDPCIGDSGPFESEATAGTSSFVCENDQGVPFPQKNHENFTNTEHQEDDSVSDKDDMPSLNEDTEVTCIINEREKLKETEAYKKAVAEEWASRYQVLQIQSKEVRHQRLLNKRRRAESKRLLDMEKRQRERVEELRNTQKEDEENMNLKETIRGEVKNELQELEANCKTMQSLLHLLGIQVGGWPNPSQEEIQMAYKRAILTFHPDRAPQSDIRKQVEAEERFKLVNRSMEKFRRRGKCIVK